MGLRHISDNWYLPLNHNKAHHRWPLPQKTRQKESGLAFNQGDIHVWHHYKCITLSNYSSQHSLQTPHYLARTALLVYIINESGTYVTEARTVISLQDSNRDLTWHITGCAICLCVRVCVFLSFLGVYSVQAEGVYMIRARGLKCESVCDGEGDCFRQVLKCNRLRHVACSVSCC